jgi:hypothetical protein
MGMAVQSGKPVHGVVGETPLAKLEGVDFVQALLPEYMHEFCQGVCKKFIKLWTSPKNSKQPWYVTSRNLEVVNRRLSLCFPPYDITRTRFDLNDLPNWKAAMFKAFALYYFVVFEGYLAPRYFLHFSKLSFCLFVLLQDSVSVQNIKVAESLLKSVVVEMEELYGIEEIGINVHFLTHLGQAVLNWGCLWTTSTWFNGELLSLKNGTQFVADQMCRNYLMKMIVRRDACELILNCSLPRQVTNALVDLLNIPSHVVSRSLKGLSVNDNQIVLLGKPQSRAITTNEKVALLNCCSSSTDLRDIQNFVLNLKQCAFYPRFRVCKSRSIFTTCSYTRSKKRINYYALLREGIFIAIESIVLIETLPIPRAFIIGQEMGSFSKDNFFPASQSLCPLGLLGQTVKLVGKGPTLLAFDPINVIAKCFYAINKTISDDICVTLTAVPNHVETD